MGCVGCKSYYTTFIDAPFDPSRAVHGTSLERCLGALPAQLFYQELRSHELFLKSTKIYQDLQRSVKFHHEAIPVKVLIIKRYFEVNEKIYQKIYRGLSIDLSRQVSGCPCRAPLMMQHNLVGARSTDKQVFDPHPTL